MVYILLGSLSFIVAYLFDFVSLRKFSYLKPVLWFLVVVLIGYSHIMVGIRGDRFSLPARLSHLGWLLLLLASLALIYSLYLEIPFKQTYAEKGAGDRLVTTGTYALVRHPGVLWYAIFLSGLILASSRWLALLAAPIWLLIDVLYVWMQEKVIFNQMFPEYEQYKQHTPMLIPNRRSITRCLQTFRVG